MLTIKIPDSEYYDNLKEEFIIVKGQTLRLEHSLVSISKWESKWKLPFLVKGEKTNQQILDYVRCMTITQNVDPNVYGNLTVDNLKSINEYLDDQQTATTFGPDDTPPSRTIATSELIYYWMFSLGIDKECEKWPLGRLMTLINIFNIKNQPKKKRGRQELLRRNRDLNAARLEKYNTRG